MTVFLLVDVLAFLLENNPSGLFKGLFVLVWVVMSFGTILFMIEQAKKNNARPLYRSKWVRVVAAVFPLVFWTGLAVYGVIVHFILDETGPPT